MRRHSIAAMAVAALVVLAGCGGILNGGDGGSGPSTIEVDPGTLPGGVSEDGITNGSQLAKSHAAGLSETGFRATYSLSVLLSTQQGNRQQSITQEVKATAGLNNFWVNATTVQGPQTALTQYWGNESLGLSRSIVANQTRFRKLPASVDRQTRFTLAATLDQLIRIADYGITGTEEVDGTTEFTLQANSVNTSFGSGSAGAIDSSNVSNVSSRLVVDAQGVIQEFELSFNATTGTGEAFYSVSFEVTSRSGVSVSKPAWIDDALQNVTIANLSASIEQGVVSITHDGGDTISTDAQLIVQTNGSIYQGGLSEPLEPGDMVYLSLNRSAGSVELVSDAANATEVSGQVAIQMFTQNQQVLLQAQLNASETDGT
jgi:hypothetical protein